MKSKRVTQKLFRGVERDPRQTSSGSFHPPARSRSPIDSAARTDRGGPDGWRKRPPPNSRQVLAALGGRLAACHQPPWVCGARLAARRAKQQVEFLSPLQGVRPVELSTPNPMPRADGGELRGFLGAAAGRTHLEYGFLIRKQVTNSTKVCTPRSAPFVL